MLKGGDNPDGVQKVLEFASAGKTIRRRRYSVLLPHIILYEDSTGLTCHVHITTSKQGLNAMHVKMP